MKIIDEKGRLFGKINIIDFALILFLFCFISIFYFSYKLFTKKEKPKTFIDVEISCKFIKVEPQVLQMIAVGDKEMDDNGAVIGEIIWLGGSSPYKYKFETGNNKVIIKEDSILKETYAKLKLKAEMRNDTLYYKDNRITVDSPIYFKTDRYAIAMIPFPVFKQKVLLKVKFQNLILEIPKLINIGDEEKDKEGDMICRVKSIISNKPSEVAIQEGGKMIIADHPVYRDVILLMETVCVKRGDELFFKEKAVKVGNSILLATEKYDISGIIIGMNK